MQVELRIRRFNPETDAEPHWESYDLEADPTDRVLDLLHQVKWFQDGTLTFRRSCAHGVCGSDAMLINGRNRLACATLVRDAGERIEVEAMRGLPLVKDLLVDQERQPSRRPPGLLAAVPKDFRRPVAGAAATGRVGSDAGKSSAFDPIPVAK